VKVDWVGCVDISRGRLHHVFYPNWRQRVTFSVAYTNCDSAGSFNNAIRQRRDQLQRQRLAEPPQTAGANPVIGVDNIGRFTITPSSVVISNVATIGRELSGIGFAVVSGFDSSTGSGAVWSTNNMIVGSFGTGTLEILDGALVTVDFAGNPGSGDLIIGQNHDGVGTVVVSGRGSLLRMGDDTFIGHNTSGPGGTGTLIIEDEGFVVATNDAASGMDTVAVGARGRVELNNGRLRTEDLDNNGAIVGHGRVDSELTISNLVAGRFEVGPGDRMVVNGGTSGGVGFDNDGEVVAVGGELEFLEQFTNTGQTASVTLLNGVVHFPIPTTGFGFDSTGGVLASTGGTNDIYGTVRIQGASSRIVAAGESTAVFHEPVTNSGATIEVFPGSTAVYLQGLTTTGSGSALSVHLADPDEEPDFGSVEVSGAAALDGTLQVQLASGFVPSLGDAFQILTASGGRTGTFTSQMLPPLSSGLDWELQYTPNSVMLSVISTVLPGDYNGNGIVDAADFVVWRKTDGSQSGYDEWRTNFGRTAGAASRAALGSPRLGEPTSAVPEPAAILMVLTALLTGALGRRPIANRKGGV
jgi:T5SS/PEP-CTERM-associated repeat protein